MTCNTITSIEWDTVYTADCVEFCPINEFSHLFIVGTYQLKVREDTTDRLGKLYLLTVNDDKIKVLQTIGMSGILDARWSPQTLHGMILLTIANAYGNLLIYKFIEEDIKFSLIHSIAVSTNLCLYIDWSNILDNNQNQIAVSDSGGAISIYSINSDNEAPIIHQIKGHQYEAWVTSFNYWQPTVLYSGGDDSILKGYDIRTSAYSPIFSSKEHNGGVTSIHQVIFKDNLLLTGSYDELLRIWDSRNMKRPQTSLNLDGGVWRLRNHPLKKPLILASCMHGGFKVIELDDSDQPKVVAHYTNHKSLAYGADWSRQTEKNDYLIASVSFYDHLLCLWKYDEA